MDPEQRKLALELKMEALAEKKAAIDKNRFTQNLVEVAQIRNTKKMATTINLADSDKPSTTDMDEEMEREFNQLLASQDNYMPRNLSMSQMHTTASKLVGPTQSNTRGTRVEMNKMDQ